MEGGANEDNDSVCEDICQEEHDEDKDKYNDGDNDEDNDENEDNDEDNDENEDMVEHGGDQFTWASSKNYCENHDPLLLHESRFYFGPNNEAFPRR